jgi:octaprenyl-diphosphate synthase
VHFQADIALKSTFSPAEGRDSPLLGGGGGQLASNLFNGIAIRRQAAGLVPHGVFLGVTEPFDLPELYQAVKLTLARGPHLAMIFPGRTQVGSEGEDGLGLVCSRRRRGSRLFDALDQGDQARFTGHAGFGRGCECLTNHLRRPHDRRDGHQHYEGQSAQAASASFGLKLVGVHAECLVLVAGRGQSILGVAVGALGRWRRADGARQQWRSRWFAIIGLTRDMSLSTDSAVRALSVSAKKMDDTTVAQRLEQVQSLLEGDLEWVEAALGAASSVLPPPIDETVAHLVSRGGKRIRPTSVLLSAACVGPITEAVKELAVVVELVHTATLLHDDVIDEGMERRSAPTARRIWGNAMSVLAGDTLLVHSLGRIQKFAPQLLTDLLETLQRLVGGEVLQLKNRTELDLSVESYDYILREKTASLFQFATAGGARLAGASRHVETALGEFGERLGMAFQLVDDVLDYEGQDTGKTLGADLIEGKVTLPLVLSVKQRPELVDLINAVRQDPTATLVEELRQQVVASGACETVRLRAAGETEAAITALTALGDSPARRLLTSVAQRLAQRVR